ncbi:tol-pal system protein YbgF [Aquabacterium sp.]|uniref:tol-pal system protein YbgF n=1 Tax=Aquabacterium sp. TaxID=1872578 RepID=UPI003D6D3AC2
MGAALMLNRVRPLVLAVLAACASLSAHAGLLDDDEARRAILELRQQRTKDTAASDAKLRDLNAQLDQVKRSLVDLNAQIEQLRSDLAKQSGQNELLTRDLSELQRHQKDLQQGVDERVRKLEPQTVSLDGKTFQVEPEEKTLFEDALAKLRQADFAGGAAGLNGLLKRYPASGYRESALYWQGNAQYGLREYKDALVSFKALLTQAPTHARAPEALLSIANCHTELKETKAARKALDDLIKNYPDSEAAQAARERLASANTAAAKARKN